MGNTLVYRTSRWNAAALLALATLSFTAAPASADALLMSSSSGPFNLVPGMESGVTLIGRGADHNLTIKDGSLYASGNNQVGQLGNGTNTNGGTHLLVPGMENGVTDISAGAGYSLVIRNGAALTWGYNFYGQLGNGTSTNSNVPVPVTGMSSGVTAIAGLGTYSMALKDGALYTWGSGGFGQLGNGANANSYVPVSVTGMESGVTSIAAGFSHGLAIQNGALKAWGWNDAGQLGIETFGSNANRNVPVSVIGMESGVTAIAAGARTSLAVKDGNVYAWGLASSNQNWAHTVPLLVLDHDADFVDVAAGRNASGYALSSDGSLWAWTGFFPSFNFNPTQILPPQGYKFTDIDASSGSGSSTAAFALIAPRTTYGDANLDGRVNFDDLLALAQHYGTTAGATWTDGDFNLDNAVDFSDLLALAQHYGVGPAGSGSTLELGDATADFQRDWALALSIVPEPASISLMTTGTLLGLRRRR